MLEIAQTLFKLMNSFLDMLVANSWNRVLRLFQPKLKGGLLLGKLVTEGRPTKNSYFLPHSKRTEHIAVLGKTGTGKSSLLRQICLQDIRARRGFAFFDLHGDATPYLLSAIADQEQRFGVDLSDKLILIEPADPEFSVGVNVLSHAVDEQNFARLSEITSLFENRWDLSLGARTVELLRNSLHVLAANHLTLVELSPLLHNAALRAKCLKRVLNLEICDYFTQRYDTASPAMQSAMRDPVLNKISEFVSDPHFRHIVGQQHSTFSVEESADASRWIILKLDKGRLGPQALLLAGLFLSQLKTALFRRKTRKLFSLFLDEVQNLVSPTIGIDTLLSESRKFGIGVCSANQYLSQYQQSIRSAILSVGTLLHFQLSGEDSEDIAKHLDGGKSLSERLRNLAPRHFIAKSGHYSPYEVLTPELPAIKVDYADLVRRSQIHYARKRSEIEADIQARKPKTAKPEEVLSEWQ